MNSEHVIVANVMEVRSVEYGEFDPTPVASFFFRGTHKVWNNLGRFSIIYFRGLGLRIMVRVRVRDRVWVRIRVRARARVRVWVSVVLWSW